MNRLKRTLLIAALPLIFATLDTLAQETASAVALSPESYQRLTGEIRWKKELGVPAAAPDSAIPATDICGSFYVLAFEPHPMPRARPMASDLQLERPKAEDETHYRCRYEMRVPHGTRLLILPGVGDASRYWESHAFRPNQWIGGPKPQSDLKFDRSVKYVTLGRAKATWLAFELGAK